MSDLPLRCKCGSVTGVVKDVSPKTTTRLVCMCEDCQAFTHFLERTDVLDDYGGTEVAQTTPSRIELDGGVEHVRCARLSDKGMYRFYASCCNTPLANTLSPKIPFAAVFSVLVDDAEKLGPVRAKVNGRCSTRGAPPPDGHARAPIGIIFRALGQLGRGVMQSASRPNPFFGDDAAPRFETLVLEHEERDRLRASVAAAKKS